MFEIIDENKNNILSDNDYARLRTTALLLAKETENGFIPMFTEDTVDKSIIKHADFDTKLTKI
jgi:hypothetical protein